MIPGSRRYGSIRDRRHNIALLELWSIFAAIR